MEQEDLVSIIMPAYNAEKYISKAIESVLNQTYQRWELLIINDCSTDNTVNIVNSYKSKDSRIKLITNEQNSGISVTRNKGIKEKKGRFLAFLDSDDIWYENKLSKQISFMKKNNYAFTFSSYVVIDGFDQPLNKVIEAKPIVDFKQLLKTNYFGCLTVVIDTKFIKFIEMPKIKHEDYATWLNILKDHNINAYGLDEVLAKYRKTNTSTSANKFKAIGWNYNIYKKGMNYSTLKSTFCLIRYLMYTSKKYLF